MPDFINISDPLKRKDEICGNTAKDAFFYLERPSWNSYEINNLKIRIYFTVLLKILTNCYKTL